MKYLSKEECREIELNILRTIDSICQDNKIKYFMCGGTMLGAIRHKGFIPWDDDIDIALLRPDYEKLITILKTQTKYEWLKLLDVDTSGYYYTFAKAVDTTTTAKMEDNTTEHGLWVDIFPYDNLPNDSKLRKKYLTRGYYYRSIIQSITFDSTAKDVKFLKRIIKMILKLYASFINPSEFTRKYISFSKKYNSEDTQYVGCLFTPYRLKECFDREWFRSPQKYVFEEEEFFGPNDAHSYLTQLYGSYMELPPIEKRRDHKIIAWKNDELERTI